MPFAKSDAAPPRSSLHSRIALALAHAAVDSQTKQRIIAFGSTVKDEEHDYVQDLLNECAAAWSELIDHPFPGQLANGTAALNGFRHYMIQDGTYLEYYYRVRMEAISKTGTFEEIQEFAAKLSSSLAYVAEFRQDLTNKLGVPAADVTGEEKSQELQNSISLYENVVKNGDWLDIHIVLLPCILGYNVIASGLLRDPETVRNTLYFPMWVQANSGGSSATKYRQFINSNIGNLTQEERDERWPGWVENFTTACGTEKDFLGLGSSGNFPAYNIVSDGTYRIRSFSKDVYLTLVGAASVTTQKIEPQDKGKVHDSYTNANAQWKLTNTPNGYTIENVAQPLFLAVSISNPIQPIYDISASVEGHPWTINPVQVYGTDGAYLAYQLLVPESLRFVLDLVFDATSARVFVANNSEISSQFWLLESVQEA